MENSWIKKHADTVVILGGIITSIMWMNHGFNDVDKRFNVLEKEIAVMKTVLVMKDVMPKELATVVEK